MKIIIAMMLCVSLLALSGCKNEVNINSNNGSTQGTTASSNTDPTTPTSGNQTSSGDSSFDGVDWEGPIDVDENAETLPPATQDPTEPYTTQPDGTEPQETGPDATAPGVTEPPVVETNPVDPTDPPITTDPDGSIQLPFIPG